MTEYKAISRKYRPQTFKEVFGQDNIVTTLKNAIKHQRLAHAYLFTGSRGTGKTTFARLLAKTLNCPNLNEDIEPCNHCPSCKEIANGSSLDVLEIDGASHRGIDDIRQINETVGYSTSTGGYKIYIIDEVHMLTKEAFNALLKTLEEPPERVKFLFATTEPHKVLPTILSRCQRFNLNRIPNEKIIEKLHFIIGDLGLKAEEEALHLIANRAEGGLRDAESLLDQVLSFHDGDVTTDVVASILGVVTRNVLFALDEAGKSGKLSVAFEIAHQIYSEGKDIGHFVETLIEHFRNILLVKLSGQDAAFLEISNSEREMYGNNAKYYSQEQCMNILDYLLEAQSKIRFMPSSQIALEAILLHVIRSHRKVPIEFLVRRLVELENSLGAFNEAPAKEKVPEPVAPPVAIAAPQPIVTQPAPQVIAEVKVEPIKEVTPEANLKSSLSLTEDPTPTADDLKFIKPAQKAPAAPAKKTAPAPVSAPKTPAEPLKEQSHYDTILQFASIELEGKIDKKR